MHKCVCGEYIKHICALSFVHETKIHYAHICLRDTCILSSQNQWELICVSEHNRRATAELERHYIQNGRGNQLFSVNHRICACDDICLRHNV